MIRIPILSVSGESLPVAWEKAMLLCYMRGMEIATQYDKEGDPLSRDCTMTITVENPFRQPRMHLNIPCGPAELEIYRQEVVLGIHDHWIGEHVEDTFWEYTYHDLIKDQIEPAITRLADCLYTRRANIGLWIPEIHCEINDPPCLQRIWLRAFLEVDVVWLEMHTYWRSRDAYKAWMMNAYALTSLQSYLAALLQLKLKVDGVEIPVCCGQYMDHSDSFHIYGSYMDDSLIKEIKKFGRKGIELRTVDTSKDPWMAMTNDTTAKLLKNPDFMRNDLKISETQEAKQ